MFFKKKVLMWKSLYFVVYKFYLSLEYTYRVYSNYLSIILFNIMISRHTYHVYII